MEGDYFRRLYEKANMSPKARAIRLIAIIIHTDADTVL